MRNSAKIILWLISTIIPMNAQAQISRPEIIADPDREEVVFSWKRDKCFSEHIPDSPARAFRSPTGRINLYASHYINTPLIGTDLGNVKPACDRKFSGAMNPGSESYDARIWLQTFYSTDNGKTIYSLASSDYHGMWFDNCEGPNNINHGCWWSAIVLVKSTDGGITFKKAPKHRYIIARSPHQFSRKSKGPVGFLTTSNIIKKGRLYYSIFNVSAYKEQDKGNCLARTSTLDAPSSWQVWSGDGYDSKFYTSANTEGLEKYEKCQTLQNMPYKVRSLTWHNGSGKFVASFERSSISKGEKQIVFSYAWSDDLINWSLPVDIIRIKNEHRCNKQPIAAYPSIIDGNSKDRNFVTVGENAYLYFTRFNLSSGCRPTLDRDLVRIPIEIKAISG